MYCGNGLRNCAVRCRDGIVYILVALGGIDGLDTYWDYDGCSYFAGKGQRTVKIEVRCQRSEVGGQKTEVGSRMSEVRRIRGGLKADN